MGLADIPDDWQHEDIRKAVQFCRKFDCAIDGGAHRGVITRLLATMFKQVVAIEPSELADRIEGGEVIRKALGDAPGRCGMAEGRWSTGQKHVVPGSDFEIITLDSLGLAPDFLKLDVEGMEYQALKGAEETIRTHRPIVMIEENGLNRRYGVKDGQAGALLESWGAIRVAVLRGKYPPDEDWVYAWGGV